MRQFTHIPAARQKLLFSQLPGEVSRSSPRHELAQALGATLYIPGFRHDLAATVQKQALRGVTSVVVCLEDSVPDSSLSEATRGVVAMLDELASHSGPGLPLLFLRPRSPIDAEDLLQHDHGGVLTGVVIPKFTPSNAHEWLSVITGARTRSRVVYAMPILEAAALLNPTTRVSWLHAVHKELRKFPDATMALRIGTTDIAGSASLRRSRDLTIYDLVVVRDVIAAILAEFLIDRHTVPVVTAGVWEHYPEASRLARPQLRQTPFANRGQHALREELIALGLDKLAEEVALDLANGLRGKTVIHPSHVALVNSLHTVGHEEYADAHAILTEDGAHASQYRNKMNESRPHQAWACEVINRARAFGVLSRGVTWVDVLGEFMDAVSDSAV